MRYAFKARLWVYPGDKASWRFITIPKGESRKIKESKKPKRGFGSVRVRATIGETRWDTSIFPDSKSGTYVLPVKAAVRRAEGIEDGDIVSVNIKLF